MPGNSVTLLLHGMAIPMLPGTLFARMIPAGLNFMATGCPYWTVDIGAFFTKKRWSMVQEGIIIKEWLIWDIVSCIPVCFNMAHSCLYFVAMVPILP